MRSKGEAFEALNLDRANDHVLPNPLISTHSAPSTSVRIQHYNMGAAVLNEQFDHTQGHSRVITIGMARHQASFSLQLGILEPFMFLFLDPPETTLQDGNQSDSCPREKHDETC